MDLGREDQVLKCNWWNWRPTLELLRTSALIDDERLELMGCNGTAVRIKSGEAQDIADFLGRRVLGQLNNGDRVMLGGAVNSEPDDFVFHRTPQDMQQNYSATIEWLSAFVVFCRSCEGFKVL